jgi:NADPH:quinone reductase-like Zn-dependent oxidoreductase
MRVRASSLNYRDLMVLKGGGRGPTKPDCRAASDGVVRSPPWAMGSRGSGSATGSSAPSFYAGSADR